MSRDRQAALAAEALQRGEPSPGVDLLRPWRFARHPGLPERILAHLHASGAAIGAANPGGLPWALATLADVGAEIEGRERQSWARQTRLAADAERDRQMADCWRLWFQGRPWDAREAWEELLLDAAIRAFSGVMQAQRVPPGVTRSKLRDVEEAFFYHLLGGREAGAGWRTLAARVLETGPTPPVERLEQALLPQERPLVRRCAALRGYGPRSAAVLWPDLVHAGDRARAMATLEVEALLDCHVAVRLIDLWAGGAADPARTRRVVTQNRGRARGRLRAVVAATELPHLQRQVLGLDALAARTTDAVKRYCRDWAWQQLAMDFAFDADTPVDVPCDLDPEPVPALAGAERAQLETWVLLVMLKGHLPRLLRWIRTGGTGDGDTGWGRLLSEALPAALIDRGPADRRSRGYTWVRALLAENQAELLYAHHARLAQIAALTSEAAGLERRFQALLDPIWSPEVPRPRVRARAFCGHAAAALDLLAALDVLS